MIANPIQPFLERYGVLILDGGLATELEARGHDLSDSLWSARLLRDNLQAIKQVHLDYLRAGADCIISASYQATIPGYVQHGLSEAQAVSLLQRSVELAREARDSFWETVQHTGERLRPLVAASIGPYGAYLADGSEYSGRYGLDQAALIAFHRRRWQILVESAPDVLACETIPSAVEARALAHLLSETPDTVAWFSFSCRDEQHISDGTRLRECVEWLDAFPQVVAIGVNCTAPRFVPALIAEARRVSRKPIIAYPNSGETYDVGQKRWLGLSIPADFAQQSGRWREAGAALIGGCCRTRPDHIREIRVRQRVEGEG
ncbi:MAG TPA: homocysteine S-methyltransferase [Candidatus Sulfomarinibacteraceae bacterium]|nr:homocysteine S-methyltransferase [Candidatus Sulfomarinibacteraceae bacterium]